MSQAKPTALRVLEGNPSKRPLPANEPTPEVAIPSAPRGLPKLALAEWRRITPELAQLKLVTRPDRAALVAYCLAWARMVEAERIVEREGMIVEGSHGGRVKHPALNIAHEAAQRLRGFASEFGLSPAARTRIQVGTGETPKKKREKFFGA